MNMPEKFVVTPEQMTVELTEQQIYHVGKSEKFGLILGMIRRDPDGRYLVFCNMKVTAERLKRMLEANGVLNAAITGDLPQPQRLKVLANFKDGKFPVLIATDVASRGLHIEGVTHVINYDLPQDPEDYVHRIGRTGRAGAGGMAVSLASEDCVLSLPDIEDYIKQKIPVMPLTDEMIVTDYKRASSVQKKGMPAGQKQHRFSDRRPGRTRDQAAKPSTPDAAAPKPQSGTPRRRRRPSGQKPGSASGN
jgi:ATP-dependent RNA helicase RhlB